MLHSIHTYQISDQRIEHQCKIEKLHSALTVELSTPSTLQKEIALSTLCIENDILNVIKTAVCNFYALYDVHLNSILRTKYFLI